MVSGRPGSHCPVGIALAGNDLELAEANSQLAQRLSQGIERRHALGDVPLTDLLLAQTSALEAQSRSIVSRAAMLDAERSYRSLTGLDARPSIEPEPISHSHTISAEHPALRAAQAKIRRTKAARRMARETAKGNPTLLIGPRRERAAFGRSFDDSIGLALTVPLGGGVHIRAETAAAGRAVAAAQADHAQLVRVLDLQMHEAAHALAVLTESLDAATRRSELASRQYTLGQKAYQQGELGLMDLLRLQHTSFAATRAVMRLVTNQQRHTALYNQAVGDLP